MQRVLLALLLFAPVLAQAHPGGQDVGGFFDGLLHPLLGLDHLLAMLGVGILAAKDTSSRRGKISWGLPGAFVVGMTVGIVAGALAIGGAVMAGAAESLIALSLVLVGVAIALGHHGAGLYVMGMVVFLATFHGYAHGVALPVGAGALLSTIGILLATTMLHLTGMLAGGALSRQPRGDRVLRVFGSSTLLFGIVLAA